MIPVCVRMTDGSDLYGAIDTVADLMATALLVVKIPPVEVPEVMPVGLSYVDPFTAPATWTAVAVRDIATVHPVSVEEVRRETAAAAARRRVRWQPLAVPFPMHGGHLVEVLAWDGEGTGRVPAGGESWVLRAVNTSHGPLYEIQYDDGTCAQDEDLDELLANAATPGATPFPVVVDKAAIRRARWQPLYVDGVRVGWRGEVLVALHGEALLAVALVAAGSVSGATPTSPARVPVEVIGSGSEWKIVVPEPWRPWFADQIDATWPTAEDAAWRALCAAEDIAFEAMMAADGVPLL